MIQLILGIVLFSHSAYAGCLVKDSSGRPVSGLTDGIGLLLTSEAPCPTDVLAFRGVLNDFGLALQTTMVANRGFHNPSQGSFSFFETATGKLTRDFQLGPGDFFFGHFTTVDGQNRLALDQSPSQGSLMIEAFAWDFVKGYYNFYELRGDGARGQWFYRGDSSDIFADNAELHLQPNPEKPRFGNRLRCSGCHIAGGPIMKELAAPHNDWWSVERGLDFDNRKPDPTVKEIMRGLVPAGSLADHVEKGMQKLERSEAFRTFKSSLSLREQLRPLFCPMEMNFQSDAQPNERAEPLVAIPAAFFADARLTATRVSGVFIDRRNYEGALKGLGSRFPETKFLDGDHAWLTPVKAMADIEAVDSLIRTGVIDVEFASDVLAVDFTNPVFSSMRCRLLKHVPQSAESGWVAEFEENLAKASESSARELLKNIKDPSRTMNFHAERVGQLLKACSEKLRDARNVMKLVQLLDQRRQEIRASEISMNPRGQILEPGFRVIFPEFGTVAVPGSLGLSSDCEVVAQQKTR